MTTTQKIALDSLNKEHWFNWQQPACPLFLGGCFEACGHRFRETFGIPFFTSILYFRPLQDDDSRTLQGSWLLRLEEGKNCGTYLIDLLQIESFRRALSGEFEDVSNSLVTLAAQIKNQQNSISETTELAKVAKEFFDRFWRFYTLGAITEPVQWRVEAIIKQDLVASKVGFSPGAAAQHWESNEIVAATFSTNAQPYALEILDDLGRITESAKRVLERSATPVDNQRQAASVLNADINFVDLLDQHVRKYFWKQGNYLRSLDYDRSSCLDEVLRALRAENDGNTKDPKSQAEEAHKTREAVLTARAELLSSISDYHRRLIILGDEFGSGMADSRKRTMLQALATLEILAQKLSQATGFGRAEISMLMPEELEYFCRKPDLFKDRLTSRQEGFLAVESPFPLLSGEFGAMTELAEKSGSTHVPLRQGTTYVETAEIVPAFDELNSNLCITFSRGDQTVLSGDVAFSDSHKSITGKARIVRNPVSDAFEAGEILVATSTTPDFMPQIRIAKAIVTDQGGMATHAALTSRELKIPCIVGTAVGTLKIRSGDTVELDLQTGHVKIVK